MLWKLFWVALWIFFYNVDRVRYNKGNVKSLYWMGFAMAGIIGSTCELIEEALKHV